MFKRNQGLTAGSNKQAIFGIPKNQLIHCFGCQQDLAPENYSETQLKKYSTNPFSQNSREFKSTISCKKCTTKQVKKIQCYVCNSYLSLDKFSKSQRRNAKDMSTCFECMKLRDKEIESSDYNESDYSD